MDTGMESTGRVTRALRKRLTSIDSDNGSSRPGSPVQSKLASAATADSPLKPRMTRRKSISGVATPVTTPNKLSVNVVPPLSARSTRRRSVSLLANEETPKNEKKLPHFESLMEEDSGPTTRSKSKSPEQPKFKAVAAATTVVSQRRRKSMVEDDQSLNLQQDLPNIEIKNEEDECHGDINNKENNIDILNAARKKLHNVAKENLKDLPETATNFNDPRIQSQQKRTSLGISYLTEKDTEKVNLAEEPNVSSSTKKDNKPYAIQHTALDSILKKIALSSLNEPKEETADVDDYDEDEVDVVGYVIRSDDYERELRENEQALLCENVDEAMAGCQDADEMQVDTEESAQTDVEPNNKTGSGGTLTLNEEDNDDIKTELSDNENSIKFSLRDIADEQNKEEETVNINAESVISTIPDGAESSKSEQIDVESNKETLNDEHNEDIDTAASPGNNKNSRECSLRDNADDPQEDATVNINTENVISTNPNESSKSLRSTSPAPSKSIETSTPIGNVITDAYSGGNRHSLKIVAFSSNNLDDDECVKNRYPRTPASVKDKNVANKTFDDESFQAKQHSINESIVSVQDTTDVEIADTLQKEITSTQSATKTVAKDDTVVSEDNTSNLSEDNASNLKGNEEHREEDKLDDKSDAESEMRLRWYSPKVVAKSSKLDTISQDAEYSHEEKKNLKKTFNMAKNNDSDVESLRFVEEEEEDQREEGEEEEQQEEEGHDLIEDEAMAVDDYESGDSMASEERKEIIANEIPVDGESIGSHTTDEEECEDAEYDNDSFIVSDENCDEENTIDSNGSESDENVEKALKKKREYKRIQRALDTSSDEDDEPSKTNISSDTEENKVKQCASENETNSSGEKGTHDTSSKGNLSTVHDNISETGEVKTNSHNSSKLSDTPRQLQQSCIKECEDLSSEADIKILREEILRKLNHSDRFNKSVRDLNTDVDLSPDAGPKINTKNSDAEVEKPTSSESHLREVSSKSRDKIDQANACTAGEDNGADVKNVQDQEKAEKYQVQDQDKAEKNQGCDLSIPFGSLKPQGKEKPREKEVRQQSFTIGVSINDGELETEVIQNPLTSPSSNEDTDGNVLSSDDARYLEKVKHMPLGNPLVRTRRQSLALPTNPDMEIGPIQHGHTKSHKRKNLAVVLRNDFNPSQSVVDSVQLRKAELQQQTSKRKRLSKSFGGASADVSVVDIDVRHLHKRSKLSLETSFTDSLGNSKADNFMRLKVTHSSTPNENKGGTKQLNDSGVGRILSRCDDILEAANSAKLEEKLKHRKSKIRLPQKIKNIMQKSDRAVAPASKEIKKRDKAKIAVTKALKASANLIRGQQRIIAPEPNRLPPLVLQSLVDYQSVPKKKKKERQVKKENLGRRNYVTAAGNIVEVFQSPPMRKKKTKIIRLPTGNVYVEPLSPPRRRAIKSCNGMEFSESPMSPNAVGFTVCDASQSPNVYKGRKRKRISDGRTQAVFTPTWSQSGVFIEEEIPTARPQARISKRAQREANNNNFKQSAMNRGDIKRSNAREILQLRERRLFDN